MAALKGKIKYYFARLLVVVVALHTIDVSVDIDHLTSHAARYSPKYDDIDSFSEYIIETVFNDNNLVKESDTDDQRPIKHNINKFSPIVLYIDRIEPVTISPAVKLVSPSYVTRNVHFRFEDHSALTCNPPDHLIC